MTERLFTHENSGKIPLVYIFAIPVIIFLYFLQWKTHVFYGDDLATYKYYEGLKTFSEKVNMATAVEKYRPVHGIILQLLIETFGKNADGYYWFNVLIQSANSLILAHLLNLYLKSPLLSIFFGVLLGLSRFALYNIAQLTNGGALEGLALTFFLCFLYCVVQHFRSENDKILGSRNMLFAVLFANLSLYTHERYIVLLPFLLLVLITASIKKAAKLKQLGLLAILIIASLVLNVVVKKYLLDIPFFVGTGGTRVNFSISMAFTFLKDAVLNIFLFNTGPEYLVGSPFSSLNGFYKLLAILGVALIVFMVIAFFRKELRFRAKQQNFFTSGIINFLLLVVLFFLLLAPAIVTIRLEQRWLQASYSVLILVTAMLLSSIKFSSSISRYVLGLLLAITFLLTDHQYLSKKPELVYMISAENIATIIKKGVDNGTIRDDVENLYVWEKTRNKNAENNFTWALANGYFFEFYRGSKKNIVYIDSVYERTHVTADTAFFRFNLNTDQFVYVNKNVVDITKNFLRDSLKDFNPEGAATHLPVKDKYDSTHVTVGPDTYNNFALEGFHQIENGYRWTNGNASIGFVGDYAIKDSVLIELKTFLPPKCKDILPHISLVEVNGATYEAKLINRKGDNFFYGLSIKKYIKMSKIFIRSDTINALPDIRVLSFPFVGLELIQVSGNHKN